jgi:hypothetical protein
MTREELVDLRRMLLDKFRALEHIGDFDANAGTVRLAIECLVKLTDHAIEKARK